MMIEKLGRTAIAWFDEFLYALGFFARVLKESALLAVRGRVGLKVLVLQILFTGIEALGITAALSLAIGAAINLIGSSLLAEFGQGKLMYTILIVVIARELGPLLTAFIVIARSGTAIATELGGMAVGHEIEAYVAVGVDPISYLAAPRFLGVVASLALLEVYFDVFGLLGSFAVVQLVRPISFDEYFRNLFSVLTLGDVLGGLVKSLVFGTIISVVSLYRGFAVERSVTEVPVAGIKAVGSSFMLCIVADIVLIAVSYLG
jgi:phospholipid/cholesterol/gamma-HCH transport system permease protein